MIGVVVATHCEVGKAMVEAASHILQTESGVAYVRVGSRQDHDQAWRALVSAVEAVDDSDGVLVLTDMFGGTPSNMAMALLAEREVEVLTGVNLPMVLRAIQKRPDYALHGLAREVLDYGRRNITAASEWLSPRSTR